MSKWNIEDNIMLDRMARQMTELQQALEDSNYCLDKCFEMTNKTFIKVRMDANTKILQHHIKERQQRCLS